MSTKAADHALERLRARGVVQVFPDVPERVLRPAKAQEALPGGADSHGEGER